ncbi:pyruvate kinase, partial [Candidatus Peregrinibacteria bacterium]|nr:pyruvate kinase [Candidatus Peregrinibacteria bacterium]
VKDIAALAKAGMNVARLNFSHGTYEHHAKLIRNIHKAEKETGKRIGILQDLQGPKIRIGEMPKEGIGLKKDETFTLTTRKITGKKNNKKIEIPIKYKDLTKDIKKNDIILINDGLIESKATKVTKTGIVCKVKFGGVVKTRHGVNFPTASISTPTITAKDKKDLKFGLKHNVDFVALSFVKSKKDTEQLRDLVKKEKKEAQIIAKIERHEAVKNLKEIIKASDGVMVARGDLGSDINAEQVPIVQKRMITLANRYGKPVITATQVLQSMVKKSKATRAEISDAANAVFDHTDAIMLSNESAVGKYPVKATTTLTKVASTVEKEMQKHEELLEHIVAPRALSALSATCLNACELAIDTKADFIAVYTTDGYTARQIAKHRLYIPIITITPDKKAARFLTLVWGINRVIVKKCSQKDPEKLNEIIKILNKEKITKKGDKIVIVCNASKKEGLISTTKL